jgi:protein O-GlcNAc transferase
MIVGTLADYEALALKLAREPETLANIKSRLVSHRDTLPLFDTPRFCRHLEAAYETMMQRHLRGEAPESFAVPSAA